MVKVLQSSVLIAGRAVACMQVHKQAKSLGQDVADAYILKHVTHLVQRKLYCDAAQVLSEHGTPAAAAHLPLYLQLALGILALPSSHRSTDGEAALDSVLRALLAKLQVCWHC